eukprot:2222036-Rhodomonas_salina.1
MLNESDATARVGQEEVWIEFEGGPAVLWGMRETAHLIAVYQAYFYGPQVTLYALRFTLYALRFTLYGLRFTLYALRVTVYGSRFTVRV